ncbi:MAG: serine hydrolase [Arenicellales bacterium]|nr:serine hydrolase [Arenicellales bacterium]
MKHDIHPAASSYGFDEHRLREAIDLSLANEIDWPCDLYAALEQGVLDSPPYNIALGITRPRGGVNGVVLRRGETVATWGDVERPDFTFSVAKSYLALLAGVAFRDGLITDVDAPLYHLHLDDSFSQLQNRTITWRHLLQQTSEWEGTLFDLPDLVDRNRGLAPDGDNALKGTHRDLQRPGQFWEYNDVRINLLSLCLLKLFARPLPEVLRDEIMRPLGTSDTWHWHGYRNSFVEVDGRSMVSVPGGTHWGGGLCINSLDQALIGELVLQRGYWSGEEILPAAWIEEMLSPCEIRPDYGYLWWLNTSYAVSANADTSDVFAMGAGGNVIWINLTNELVVVVRWLQPEMLDRFIAAVLKSISE